MNDLLHPGSLHSNGLKFLSYATKNKVNLLNEDAVDDLHGFFGVQRAA